MTLIAIAALPLGVWVYLIAARGGFWRLCAPSSERTPGSPPEIEPRRVVAIVPARDEAQVIGAAVQSLLAQDFSGSVRVIVVDDASSDGTARVAREAAASVGAEARLSVITARLLPEGWTGKLWAMAEGVAVAHEFAPDYLLFTDADIYHAPRNVAALVARAESERRDLVSYMVKLIAHTFPERCLIPAFVFFFFKLYPPAWIASQRSATAGAAGGCMLVRPEALARAGGLESIRSEIIDDCALARIVKRAGGSIWLGVTQTASSLRGYGSFAAIGHMISRTAFNQLRHSYWLLAGTLLGLGITYLAPPCLLLFGTPTVAALGAAAWLLMSLGYLPTVRFYRLSPLWCVCLPGIAAFYAVATLNSAVQYRLGAGGAWKGRLQDRPVAR